MKNQSPQDSLSKRAFVSPKKGNLRSGAEIMQQHMRDRDYCLSRNVINQVQQWQEQQKGPYAKKTSLDEFVKDPLGE